jgi:hypothetical protein
VFLIKGRNEFDLIGKSVQEFAEILGDVVTEGIF